MKKPLNLIVALLFALVLLNISCRQEETLFVEAPQEEALKANSAVADLLQRTAMKDGSDDNIIDNSSCFSIELPVTLEVNDLEIIIDSKEDFATIEEIFDEFDDDDDELIIIFPITIVLSDFTEVSIGSFEEFESFSDTCNGENEYDDDIECADIKYPFTATIFDQNNEVVDTITINSDKELYDFIDDLDENDVVNVNFPITVILVDGSEVEASSLDELESILDNARDDCDEDDDNDYNDDDCENCTPNLLSNILVGCTNWTLDTLERNNEDLTDLYVGYQFNFMTDGTLFAIIGNGTFPGTWESNGSGNNMSVTINIPNLDSFNETWNLHEIEAFTGETKVDLRLGEDDRLRFENSCTVENGDVTNGGDQGDGSNDDNDGSNGEDDDCENCTTDQLSDALVGCSDWTVDKLELNDQDLEDQYSGYHFNFTADGSISVSTGNTSFSGNWESNGNGNNITVTIDIPNLSDFNGSWNLHEIEQNSGEHKVDLRRGGDDRLRFESNCTGNSNGNDDNDGSNGEDDDCENCSTDQLSEVLEGCSEWTVDKLELNDQDLEDQYSGYQFSFSTNGEISVSSGANSYSGNWQSTGSGNNITVSINIQNLSDFNGSWNLHEIEQSSGEKKVDLRRGGDDRLRFESNCTAGSSGNDDSNDGNDDDGGNDNGDDDNGNDEGDNDCENCNTDQLSEILVGCSDWRVDKLERNDNDLEDQYSGYRFNFNANGTISANAGSSTFSGTWTTGGNSSSLTIDIPDLPDFNATWNVHGLDDGGGDRKVDLRIGGDDRLRFESNCSG